VAEHQEQMRLVTGEGNDMAERQNCQGRERGGSSKRKAWPQMDVTNWVW
jgi:hypothetical protein